VDPRLRVLYLTHHGPWPATSGGRVRDAALIPEIAHLADVSVWAISRSAEQDRAALGQRPAGTEVRVYDDRGPRLGYPTRDSTAARMALLRQMRGSDAFDVIHVEGHYLFHLLPDEARHRAVVVEHNVESHLLGQYAGHHRIDPALTADLLAVRSAEEHAWASAPLTLTLSEEDRERILLRVPDARVRVSTNGADHIPLTLPAERRSTASNGGPIRFGYLANYAYPPNQDALDWLLDEIFPALRDRLPGCRLVLAGSGLAEVISGRPIPPGVDTLGWVDCLQGFWDQIDLMLCPLRVGGGIKVKMIEAVRSGVLAVSTPVGVEGLLSEERDAVLLADSAEDFVNAAVTLSTDSSLRQSQRKRVARAQLTQATWADVAFSTYQHWVSVSRPVFGGVNGR
jgi:glycosyltransferase involved in cell wall biosynthesis